MSIAGYVLMAELGFVYDLEIQNCYICTFPALYFWNFNVFPISSQASCNTFPSKANKFLLFFCEIILLSSF
jgi:hypothetical protein